MLSGIRSIALLSFAAASTLAAQGPGGPDGPGASGGPSSAKLLLANTAELDLSDAQVVKLAAIARRSEVRRRTMRAAMDSARVRFSQPTPGDSTARRQFRDRMRADFERAGDQGRADQRDAIAVLTPDQQGRAWEMVSNRNPDMGRGMRRGGMGRGTRRPGPGMGRGMRGPGPGMGRGFGPGRRGDDMPRQPRPLSPLRQPDPPPE